MEKRKDFRKNNVAHLVLGIVFVLLGIAVLAEIIDVVPWRMRDIIFFLANDPDCIGRNFHRRTRKPVYRLYSASYWGLLYHA